MDEEGPSPAQGRSAGLPRGASDVDAQASARAREPPDASAALGPELEDRRAADDHIKTLVQRLVSIQEEERRRIARDIHDQVGQQITALRLSIEVLISEAQHIPAIAREAARVLRLSEELDRSVDSLTSQLRPPTVDNLPLDASLGQLARDWSERFGFEVSLVRQRWMPTQFSPEVQTHVYRIVQEALHNAYKHASATQVRVELNLEDDAALIVVRDNGRGFDIDGAGGSELRTGLGLVGMRERATLCGASLSIESSSRAGTAVSLEVPLSASIWPR